MSTEYEDYLDNAKNTYWFRRDKNAYLDIAVQRKLLSVGDRYVGGSGGLALVSAFKLAQYAGGANIYGFAASVLWPAVKSLVTPSAPTSITRKFDPVVPEVTVAERQFYEPAAWASRTTSVLEMMEKRMQDIDKALEMHLPKKEASGVTSPQNLTIAEVQAEDSLFRLVDLADNVLNDNRTGIGRLRAIPPRDLEFLQKFPLLRTERHYGLTRKEYEIVERLLRNNNLWRHNEEFKARINNGTVMRFARGKYGVYNQ